MGCAPHALHRAALSIWFPNHSTSNPAARNIAAALTSSFCGPHTIVPAASDFITHDKHAEDLLYRLGLLRLCHDVCSGWLLI